MEEFITTDRVWMVVFVAVTLGLFIYARVSLLEKRLEALGKDPDQQPGATVKRKLESQIWVRLVLGETNFYIQAEPGQSLFLIDAVKECVSRGLPISAVLAPTTTEPPAW